MSHTGKRLAAFAAVIGFIGTVGWVYDFVLYPVLIATFGVVHGGLFAAGGAIVINYLFVLWYNLTESDWFGLEWLESKTQLSTSWHERALKALFHQGRWVAFIAFSCYDPLYGFIVLRGRGHSRGRIVLTWVDWFWFLIANLLGNLTWVILTYGAVVLFQQTLALLLL